MSIVCSHAHNLNSQTHIRHTKEKFGCKKNHASRQKRIFGSVRLNGFSHTFLNVTEHHYGVLQIM